MFKAMPLLLGIGDEVLNFFIVTILFAVIYVAWRSTNVREDRFQRTAVLIIENNRRRLIDRVAQHPVTISIRKSSPVNFSELIFIFISIFISSKYIQTRINSIKCNRGRRDWSSRRWNNKSCWRFDQGSSSVWYCFGRNKQFKYVWKSKCKGTGI